MNNKILRILILAHDDLKTSEQKLNLSKLSSPLKNDSCDNSTQSINLTALSTTTITTTSSSTTTITSTILSTTKTTTTVKPINCNENATLINTKCVCNKGFQGDGEKYCDGIILIKKLNNLEFKHFRRLY
jgi:hypothetical protein